MPTERAAMLRFQTSARGLLSLVFFGLCACHLTEGSEFEHLRVGDEFVYTEEIEFEGYYLHQYRCLRRENEIGGELYRRNDWSDWCSRNGLLVVRNNRLQYSITISNGVVTRVNRYVLDLWP